MRHQYALNTALSLLSLHFYCHFSHFPCMSGTTMMRIPIPQRHRSFHTGLDCLVGTLVVYKQPPCPKMTLSSSYQSHRVFSLFLSFLSCAPSSTFPSTHVWDRCPRRVSRLPSLSTHTYAEPLSAIHVSHLPDFSCPSCVFCLPVTLFSWMTYHSGSRC